LAAIFIALRESTENGENRKKMLQQKTLDAA
jgi:hypothetical protein